MALEFKDRVPQKPGRVKITSGKQHKFFTSFSQRQLKIATSVAFSFVATKLMRGGLAIER